MVEGTTMAAETVTPGVAPAVEVDAVGKSFGHAPVLADVSFDVQAGQVLGILGPNGAGKTTLIRILTTMYRPSSGRFAVAGVDGRKPREIRRFIGVLPESAGYPRIQTGDEYLTYHARLFGLSREQAKDAARKTLEIVQLGDRAGSLIATYSRGMLQRLGIARVLISEPRVVFLDEPTLGLDPAGRRHVLDTIRRISAEDGRTILLSTHVLADAEEICSRILVLNRGRVAAQGTVAEVSRRFGADRHASLSLPPEQAEAGTALLVSLTGVKRVSAAADEPGALTVVFDGQTDPDRAIRLVVGSLLDAGIAVRSFELDRARLSDAFLAITQDDAR